MRHATGEKMDWTVDLVDTGLNTQTGGRLKRLAPYLGNSTFMMTYGDGVSDVNIKQLVDFHKKSGKTATLTAVRPPARFGHMHFEGDLITKFTEKPQTESGWINGGFFVLEPKILQHIQNDETWFEREPLEACAAQKTAQRLQARRLLAVHGHAARQAPAGRPLELRRGAVGARHVSHVILHHRQ
jgi:glucose-1-phosphate cytidylyltransferase